METKTAADDAQLKADKISEIYQKDRTLSYSLPALKAMMSAYGLCQSCVLPPMIRLAPNDEQIIKKLTLSQFGDLTQINSIY